MDIRAEIERAAARKVKDIDLLGGGCVGQVYHVQFSNGEQFVAKVDDGYDPNLDIEAHMLDYLGAHSALPVPQTIYSSPRLLLMSLLPGQSVFSAAAQRHAADLLAELHTHSAPAFGFDRPTLIGGLIQPNDWSTSWLNFFGSQRLIYMAGQGVKAGRLPGAMVGRLERLVSQLDRWLHEPQAPELIHGDVWTSNVLADGPRITGFLDPAIYYGSAEIELAFITLFGTFNEPFFERYNELRPITPGFFEERRDIFNLYPLLVHSRLFGGSYVASVDRILRRYGF